MDANDWLDFPLLEYLDPVWLARASERLDWRGGDCNRAVEVTTTGGISEDSIVGASVACPKPSCRVRGEHCFCTFGFSCPGVVDRNIDDDRLPADGGARVTETGLFIPVCPEMPASGEVTDIVASLRSMPWGTLRAVSCTPSWVPAAVDETRPSQAEGRCDRVPDTTPGSLILSSCNSASPVAVRGV